MVGLFLRSARLSDLKFKMWSKDKWKKAKLLDFWHYSNILPELWAQVLYINFIFLMKVNIYRYLWFLFYLESHGSGLIPRAVIPVDDIGDAVPSGYAPGEKDIRCKLASLYRLVDNFGWSQSIYNHITVRTFPYNFNFNRNCNIFLLHC